MFNFGEGFGVIQGVLAALKQPYQFVEPATWKRRAGLIGKPKKAALTKVKELFPNSADLFLHGRGKGSEAAAIGRADAVLIARFGLRPNYREEAESFEDLL